MKTLAELSKLSNYIPLEGDQRKLYQLLVEEGKSRKEAQEYFKSEDYFRMTLKRLKDKLLEQIEDNDLDGFEEKQYDLHKKAMNCTYLFYRGNLAAVEIAEQLIRKAEELDMLGIAVDLCVRLQLHYSTIELNTRKFKKYHAKTQAFSLAYTQENRARSILAAVYFEIKRNRKRFDIGKLTKELELLAEDNEHYRFRLIYYTCMSLVFRYQNQRDLEIANCEEAIQFFGNQHIYYVSAWKFLKDLSKIYLENQSYRRAAIKINQSILLPPEGSFNWHLSLLQKVQLGFYSKKLGITKSALLQANKHPSNSSLVKEQWEIVTAYLSFFQKIGSLEGEPISFRLYRFLNQVSASHLMTDQLLILEGLHLLASLQKRKFLDWKEKNTTLVNNFTKKHQQRSKLFLQMLFLIEKANYRTYFLKIATKDLEKKLNKIVPNADFEVVRYDWLWENILLFLDRRMK